MTVQVTDQFLEALAIAAGFEVLEYKGEKYVAETTSLRPLEKLVTMLLDMERLSNAVQVLRALNFGHHVCDSSGDGPC